jgi:hypothetical protein
MVVNVYICSNIRGYYHCLFHNQKLYDIRKLTEIDTRDQIDILLN